MAILSAIALADFVSPLVDMKQSTLASEFADTLSLARSEAQRRRKVVVVCPRSAAGTCQNGAPNWNSGWVVFEDTDADGVTDAGEEVIRVRSNLEARVILGPNGDAVSMDPQGATIGLTDGVRTFKVSDSRVSNKRYIVLGRGGRARNLSQTDCTSAKGCTP